MNILCEHTTTPEHAGTRKVINYIRSYLTTYSLKFASGPTKSALSTYELLISSLLQQSPLIMHSVLMVQSIKYWCVGPTDFYSIVNRMESPNWFGSFIHLVWFSCGQLVSSSLQLNSFSFVEWKLFWNIERLSEHFTRVNCVHIWNKWHS